MGGPSETTQEINQVVEPWGPSVPGLQMGIDDATALYQQGGFAADPYSGQRVAGFGDTTQNAQQMILDQTGAPSASQAAQGYLSDMMSSSYQSEQLEAAKNNALASAVPAATAQFAGAGMTNSSTAMQEVGRAATQAVAPYEYDAMQRQQENALRAAGLAPTVDSGAYLPGQMAMQVGGQQDALAQANIDADMAQYYEAQNQEMNNLMGYSNLMMGMSGLGGTTSGTTTTTQPGMSPVAQAGSAALGGLGTYGALAANPVTAPFAIPAGIASGLMGLF